jgi:hypothetical protein
MEENICKKSNLSSSSFIKADNNIFINTQTIRWVKVIDDCLEVCTKSDGCISNPTMNDTLKICKPINEKSYNDLLNILK